MVKVTYNEELKNQLRCSDAHFEQLENLFAGALRLLICWLAMISIYGFLVLAVLFVSVDLSLFPVSQLQVWVKDILILMGLVSALACFLGNCGKFRNIYKCRASSSFERYKAAMDRERLQTEVVERVLVKHGLIVNGSNDNL